MTGSYIPFVSLGAPLESERFTAVTVGGVTVHHPHDLAPKPGRSCVCIRLRRALFLLAWLELENAKAIPAFD